MKQWCCTIPFFVSIFHGLAAPVLPSRSAAVLQPTSAYESSEVKVATPAPAHPVTHDLAVKPVAAETRKSVQNTTYDNYMQNKPASFAQGRRQNKSWIASWKISCDKHIKMHPEEITCPGNCPYLRSEPTRLCQFKCVPASSCNSDNPLASYANPESKMCEACKVAGCHQCGASRHDCATCQDGFELHGAKCWSANRHYLNAAFVVGAILVVFLIYYVFALFYLREEVNPEALKAGLLFRYLSGVRNFKHGVEKRYHLRTDLRHRTGVSGAGVSLIFRWKYAVIVWAIFGTVLFGIVGMVYWGSCYGMHKVNSRKSYDACSENVALQVHNFNTMEIAYFFATLIMYIVTFAGSLWFAYDQRKFFRAQDKENMTMKDFALLATGFPIVKGITKVEKDITRSLQSQPQFEGLDVVGVSVCWNFKDSQQEIADQVRREFDIEYKNLHTEESKKRQAHTEQAQESARDTKRSCGVDPKLQCIDAALGIGELPCIASGDDEKPPDQEVLQSLENMYTSGSIFIVLGSCKDRCEAFDRCQKKQLVYNDQCKTCCKGDNHNITVMNTEAEPRTVMWKGYGCDHFSFMMNVVTGCILVFFTVIILDIFFYAPYVVYILSYSDVPGMSQGGFLSGLMLGLLITVCNQIIFIVIGKAADRCGWTNSDSKDCFYCVKYTLAIFFNTCLDLGTVLILAQGYSVDQAMQMEVAADSTLSSKAVAESPNMQKALYVQLVAYIFPSCTLLPFLLEPIFTVFFPNALFQALVRSRKEVTVQNAEEILMNAPYDLSRYGDILVNMMLCCMTMGFTYCTLWQLYFYMIISMLVIYGWDHMRVLRYSCKTTFAGHSMDDAIMYMMAMPTGVLAMCLVFKAYGASHAGFLQELHSQMEGDVGVSADRYNIYMYLVCAFFGHMVIHWLLLQYVVWPKFEENSKDDQAEDKDGTEDPYSEVAAIRPANYFNTNPVNCLRSKYLYKHSPPAVFCMLGREHLLQKNEKIGLYFQGMKHEEREHSARELAADATYEDKARAAATGAWSHLNEFAGGAED